MRTCGPNLPLPDPLGLTTKWVGRARPANPPTPPPRSANQSSVCGLMCDRGFHCPPQRKGEHSGRKKKHAQLQQRITQDNRGRVTQHNERLRPFPGRPIRQGSLQRSPPACRRGSKSPARVVGQQHGRRGLGERVGVDSRAWNQDICHLTVSANEQRFLW